MDYLIFVILLAAILAGIAYIVKSRVPSMTYEDAQNKLLQEAKRKGLYKEEDVYKDLFGNKPK